MSMSDPIADMLTRIRNAQRVEKTEVVMPSSKLKSAIAQVLTDEGYIDGFRVDANDGKPQLAHWSEVLRRPTGDRASRARVASGPAHLQRAATTYPQVMNGLGVAIVSTSRGVMTDRRARTQGVGGEVLCYVA